MRPKSMILIVIAMGCGLIASIGISQVIERRAQTTGGSIETSEIFVTMVDVPIGEPLTPQMIKLEEWPMDKIPEGAITKLEDIDGRRPKQPLYAGEPILYRKLIDQNGFGGASEKIPKGYRVMSVNVTMSSAASGLILPGDRVDVLVYLRAGSVPVATTRTILEDVTVFAVNEQINREADGDGTVIHAKTVSLLVKPEQVEKLMLAEALGKLRLSLRRADDDTPIASNGASLEDLHLPEKVGSGLGDERDDVAQGSPPPQDSLVNLLESMNNQVMPPRAGMVPATPLTVMEIHSPDGISRYTWDDPTKLPRELGTGGMGPTVPMGGTGASSVDDDGPTDDSGGDGTSDDSPSVDDSSYGMSPAG